MKKTQSLKTILEGATVFQHEPKILIGPNIPKPMHGVAPRVVMGRAWWDKVRKEAYKKNEFHCQACGVHKTEALFHQWLEGHETYEVDYQRGIMKYEMTVALCHACHNFIHDGRLHGMMKLGKFPQDKFRKILAHGSSLLRKHGLARKTYQERDQDILKLAQQGLIAPWDSWRMIFDGKEFKPLKTEEQARSELDLLDEEED